MRILTVVDYDEMWPTLFENERTLLQMTLGKVISRIHHIGSTSVPGLSAKPVIDILIEVANLEELDSLNQAMEGVGYTVRGENGILNRRYFTKGGSQRSHHIHAFTTGDAQIIKHLAFRDYLIKHNDVAIQYALMKNVATGRVFKLTPERQLSIILKENSFGASGLAVHKDGRIFIASVGDMQRGSIRAIEPNGTREQMIVAPDTGFLVNDLVFDNQGGFYFTDSRGNSADPQGGVFYVSPNVGSIHAILPGLAVGNGIAIDPAGSQIWATEHAKNRLHRVRLSDATTVAPFGSVVTYQFTGPAPDGARVDSEGNVYVAISGQGRVMVFNRNGLPIGQIVLPDRDKGRNLKSTSLAIRPGHRELFIVANSGTEPGGAMIFRSGAFAPAPFPFSHQ
ncbi:GrpB family protein [Klebsiella pneumoniae]|nr:GrpB family protein [Klebsiella pneumoniae]ELB5264928.1 GrpB family protein [Klebsiella pneumoniae]